jgi:hypothetical protein
MFKLKKNGREIIVSGDYDNDDCILVFEHSGRPVLCGSVVNSKVDGDLLIIQGGVAPHKPCSTGFVDVYINEINKARKTERFYAPVIGAKWVKAGEMVTLDKYMDELTMEELSDHVHSKKISRSEFESFVAEKTIVATVGEL